jgi:Flp pilus assembly protein TadD
MVLALLATTAAAALLGACNQTGGLLARNNGSEDVQMSAEQAAGAIQQWALAYAKNPQDPKMALGYAKSLKAIGSNDRALEVLKGAYQANPADGQVAGELGRLALEMNQLNVAKVALKSAEEQGVGDWKTLSAEGTLHAKEGDHAEAQQYFLAALQKKPDAVSVINNLALSYALDGKAKESEDLLRKAVASGQDDKRVRQNLALVLGLQGKFQEARQVASVDMTEDEAKSSMAYLHNMLSKPTQFASAAPDSSGDDQDGGADWQPYAANASAKPAASVAAAAATPVNAKVQMVATKDEIEAPSVPGAKPVTATPPASKPVSRPPVPPASNPAVQTVAATSPAKSVPASSQPKPEQDAGAPIVITPPKAAATLRGASVDVPKSTHTAAN